MIFLSPFIKNAVFSPVYVFGAFVRHEEAGNTLLFSWHFILLSWFLCFMPLAWCFDYYNILGSFEDNTMAPLVLSSFLEITLAI